MKSVGFLVLLTTLSSNAVAHTTWTIRVDNSPRNCQLEAIVSDLDISQLGFFEAGFYVLERETPVPGHTLPKGSVIFVLRTGADIEDLDAYQRPVEVLINEKTLTQYQWDVDEPNEPSFFFLDGAGASDLFDSAMSGISIGIRAEFEDAEPLSFQLDTDANTNFQIYAKMLMTCGDEIAS